MDAIKKLVERELRRLEGRYRYHKLNHRDTGSMLYFNHMSRYEDRILEMQRQLKHIEDTRGREHFFGKLLQDIEGQVASFRLDYPHDDGLLRLQNYLSGRLDTWRHKGI